MNLSTYELTPYFSDWLPGLKACEYCTQGATTWVVGGVCQVFTGSIPAGTRI